MKKLLIIIVALGLATGFGLYTRQLIHETVETRNPGQTYLVSFGDSVAAGAGLSGKRQPGCDLSDAAYPLQVASQQHEQLEQFACSGATVASSAAGNTNDLVTQSKMAKSFIPGSNVVVTAGANDIGWLNLLLTCTQANCATDMNQAQIAVKLQKLERDYTSFLAQLQQARPARIVVNTYYGLLQDGGACVSNFGVTPDEASFINQEQTQLNTAITTAAKAQNATVVPIDFTGHQLCAASSWVEGVNDLAPLHPTATGQKYIAQQDVAALDRIAK